MSRKTIVTLRDRAGNPLWLKDEAAPAPLKPTKDQELLTEIRDLLRK